MSAVGAWTPEYDRWRHGGWYVTNVRYPSGACGCVSRNFADRKWRIVDETSVSDLATVRTFPNRDAAARAEIERAQAEYAKIRASLEYGINRRVAETLPAEIRDYAAIYAHSGDALRVACQDVRDGVS